MYGYVASPGTVSASLKTPSRVASLFLETPILGAGGVSWLFLKVQVVTLPDWIVMLEIVCVAKFAVPVLTPLSNLQDAPRRFHPSEFSSVIE